MTCVSNGAEMEFFIHPVRLWFAEYCIDIECGFGEEVAFPVLGRVGFFEHFRVTFDHGSNPPGFEIVSIGPRII